MSDLATLQSQLAALQRQRRSGVASLRKDDRAVVSRTDAELQAAIASLQNEIAALSGTAVRNVNIRSNKGWL